MAVTLGTFHRRRIGDLRALVESIMAAWPDRIFVLGAALRSMPSSERVEVFDYLSLSLAGRLSGRVSHGGSGALHAAAYYGLPHAACPIGLDQPFISRAFADAGYATFCDGSHAVDGWLASLPKMPERALNMSFDPSTAGQRWASLIETAVVCELGLQ